MLALANMKESTLEEKNPTNKLQLIIGLFLIQILLNSSRRRYQILSLSMIFLPIQQMFLKSLLKKGISIYLSLEKIIPFVRPACWVCHDLVAEFADISVGSGRRDVSEWNTVIVRTLRGKEVVKGAEKKGLIEIREISKENLSRLEGAALNKKKRAFKNILQKTRSLDDLLYFKVQTKRVKPLLVE